MSHRGDPRPVGIFDSGIGGLSVWREIAAQHPSESCLYVADQAHVPYGPRPPQEILRLTLSITDWLLAQDCKLIIVACNSASAAALQHLRRAHPEVPFVGMEPAIKPAAALSKRRVAGVLATPATLAGELYRSTVARYAHDMRIIAEPCPGLVGAIEACVDDDALRARLAGFVAPARDAGADVMVMACTHYPLVQHLIAPLCGPHMQLIDPAPAVARQVGRLLEAGGLRAPHGQDPESRFYTTGKTADRMAHAAGHWLGQPVDAKPLDRAALSSVQSAH